jgi:TetR/AcrR family transcriptional regulator, transcriptional repressor for nem operon
MTRYKNGHRQTTQNAIINAASDILREQGFAQTTVASVMGAIGLTVGGFYAHFKDRNQMLVAAIAQALEESPRNFEHIVAYAIKKKDVGVIPELYLSDARVANISQGCAAAALASELHRQSEGIKFEFQKGLTATAAQLAKAPGLNENNAMAAFSMLFGALMLMRSSDDSKKHEDIRNQTILALRCLANHAVSELMPTPTNQPISN